MGFGVPIEAGMASRTALGSSSLARSFCSASFSKSADSPPQKMSASGLPFHSTTRPYATGVPAGIPLVLTVTFHFSLAYLANALSAPSKTNFDTGVMRTSSSSIDAWAATMAGRPEATRSITASRAKRVMSFLLFEAAGTLDGAAPARVFAVALARLHRRRERALDARALRDGVERAPDAGAEPGQAGRPQRRRLDHARAV